MSAQSSSNDDPYVLGRNYAASGSIWLGELARELPSSAILEGFDVSDEQYPPTEWYGENVSLSKFDIFEPLPAGLVGKFDVVHLRFFMTVATDDNLQAVIDNLTAMLKPGGHLQWVERDWLSKFPNSASETDDAQTQLTCYLKQKFFPKTSWINNLPSYFFQAGLEVLAHTVESPLPVYRKPWNDDNLMGTASVGDRIEDETEREWYKDIHARAAIDAARGWYVNWELVTCVGRKAIDADKM
ncbi:MAG: hypothetical protein L6R41_002821 [Letrouitia leprolyta]|nr:MAG: hypothetical protein L6R41_002821 [Letrouitia leprolyta]